jgi:SpoVK/Ycf46/Vps4 family AAA+-type ATPase
MLHTVIEGSSGTGKTILGKIISKIYLRLGFLENDKFIIAKRSDLIGEYLGQTAMKTQRKIDEAKGGVLFIDEAYSLGNKYDRDSYSKECIDTLVSNLEERRNFVCIIAGYRDDLQSCFFSKNQGLERRFPWTFTIEKYTPEELFLIFKKQVYECKWDIEDNCITNDFFKDKMKYFDKMGGDTEILLSKCKITHSRRVFGKPRYLKNQ